MKERIQQIELTLGRHDKHLTKIQRTIDQVRWMGMGSILFFITTELGWLTALKVAM